MAMALSYQIGIEGKYCSRCEKWKSLDEFYRDRTHGPKQGYRHCRCKACQSKIAKQKRIEVKLMSA